MPLGLFSPPQIPGPVRPEDVTKGERERLRRIVTHGDPTRDTRDRVMMDRILTQTSGTEFTGPTAAFTLAGRHQLDTDTGRTIAGAMGESDVLEEERRFMSEQRLGELESQRGRDMDEFRQLEAAHEAAQATVQANFRTGLLRAGVGLAGTLMGGPVGGAIAGGVTNLLEQQNAKRAQNQYSALPEERKANTGLTSGDPGRFFDSPSFRGMAGANEERFGPRTYSLYD